MKRLLALMLMTSIGNSHAAKFFVSPRGNDKNPGTETQPFASLEGGARCDSSVRSTEEGQGRDGLVAGGSAHSSVVSRKFLAVKKPGFAWVIAAKFVKAFPGHDTSRLLKEGRS